VFWVATTHLDIQREHDFSFPCEYLDTPSWLCATGLVGSTSGKLSFLWPINPKPKFIHMILLVRLCLFCLFGCCLFATFVHAARQSRTGQASMAGLCSVQSSSMEIRGRSGVSSDDQAHEQGDTTTFVKLPRKATGRVQPSCQKLDKQEEML
jgi:hypothetical protein